MRTAIAFCLFALGAGVAGAQDSEKPRLFVLDLKAEAGVTESQARMLNELMLAELQRTGKFEIFGQADMASMFEVGKTRDLVGCDDIACVAELGGAVGADLTLVGSVGALGSLFVVSLKVINTREVKVVGRWSDTVSGEPAVLVAKIKAGVTAVFASVKEAQPKPTPAPVAAAPVATPAPAAAAPTPKPTPPPASTPPDAPPSAIEPPPAHVTAPPEAEEEGTPVYKSWWLWTAVGVVVAGGVAAAVIVATQSGGPGGEPSNDPYDIAVHVSAELPQP